MWTLVWDAICSYDMYIQLYFTLKEYYLAYSKHLRTYETFLNSSDFIYLIFIVINFHGLMKIIISIIL